MSARVLVVEDEDSILMSIEFLLTSEGYSVDTARDGAEALRLLEQTCPDLVMLDIMLPVIDGFELCRRIRADPRLRRTRVMMVTARGRDSEIEKGKSLGADAHLTKPFSTRELMAEVRRLLPA